MNQTLQKAIKHWNYIAPIVHYPKNRKEFDSLVSQLDELLDIVKDDEKHPLMGLIDVISDLIERYETKHYKGFSAKGIDALRYLMKERNLYQKDLSEIGSQGVVSEILYGKRELNLRQIKLLAKRFNVTPITFISD